MSDVLLTLGVLAALAAVDLIAVALVLGGLWRDDP